MISHRHLSDNHINYCLLNAQRSLPAGLSLDMTLYSMMTIYVVNCLAQTVMTMCFVLLPFAFCFLLSFYKPRLLFYGTTLLQLAPRIRCIKHEPHTHTIVFLCTPRQLRMWSSHCVSAAKVQS